VARVLPLKKQDQPAFLRAAGNDYLAARGAGAAREAEAAGFAVGCFTRVDGAEAGAGAGGTGKGEAIAEAAAGATGAETIAEAAEGGLAAAKAEAANREATRAAIILDTVIFL
jgi:hypothetical protein